MSCIIIVIVIIIITKVKIIVTLHGKVAGALYVCKIIIQKYSVGTSRFCV